MSKGRLSPMLGKKHSEETKRKMSLSHVGHIAWNKDKKLSEEHKRKLSQSHIGNKNTLGKNWKIKDTSKYFLSNKNKNLGKHRKLSKEICEQCKERAIRINSGKYLPHYFGEKSPLWKGGKMKDYPKLEQIRKSLEYKLWRTAVFISISASGRFLCCGHFWLI